MAISSSATGLRPGVVTSTTRPTNPYTGQIIYETDTGYLRVWDGAAWDYLSQSQDDTTNIKASDIGGPWTSFTPTLTQSVNVTNSVNYAKYVKIKNICIAVVHLTITGSGTTGSQVEVGLPINAASSNVVRVGVATVYDGSANTLYNGTATMAAANNRIFIPGDWSAGSVWGTIPSIGLASGDQIHYAVTYEAA